MITATQLKIFISRYLKSCNIFPSKKGFDYIVDGVILVINLYGKKFSVCREVYAPIAKKYGTKEHCVERDIRYLIKDSAFLCENVDKIMDGKKARVKDFLLALAKYVMTTFNIT